MRTQLHFDRIAPGGVTLPFLLAAPFFGALAAALLSWAGHSVLLSRWQPELIGAIHVYTIGFLLFGIAGALLQIGPVMTAQPSLQSNRIASRLRLMLGIGALLLGCGLFHSLRALLIPAAVLLAITLPAWMYFVARGIGKSSVAKGLWVALGGLAIGMLLGLRLATGHAFPASGLPRQWTDLHAGWMLLGGIAPLIMAVGSVVIPMFQHTPSLPALTRRLPAGAFGGMLLTTFAVMSGIPKHVATAGWIISGVSLVAFAACVLYAQMQRRNTINDPTVQLFAIAMISAIAGVTAWGMAWLFPELQRQLQNIGAVLLIAGFAGSGVHGMSMKIVPFLVRLQLQRQLWRHGRPAISLPSFQSLLPPRLSRMLPSLQAIAIAMLSLAIAMDIAWIFQASMMLMLAAQLSAGITLLMTVVRGLESGVAISNPEQPGTTEKTALLKEHLT